MVETQLVRTQVFADVAVRAAGDIRIVVAGFEMADEAGAFGDRDVVSLDDLGVAACAAEFFPSHQVSQVNLVVEDDSLESDPAFEESRIVAALPEAAFVRDLRPGFGFDIEFCPVAEDLVEALQLDPQEGADPRRIMAGAALDVGVLGLLPALVERFHVVTSGAKLGVRCVFRRAGEKEKDED
jgi:hypothetical protein